MAIVQPPNARDKPEGVLAIRSLLIGSARLLVTAGLLWALLAQVDFSHVKEIVTHLSLPLLAAGAMALLATSPFGALRWHIVLAAETTSPGPWTLLKIVLVGFSLTKSWLPASAATPSGRGVATGSASAQARRSAAYCSIALAATS